MFNIATTENYSTKTTIVVLCYIHVEEFLSATYYSLSSCRNCFWGSAATRR